MKYAIMVLALVGVLATPRLAAALTGNDLLKVCGSGETGKLACNSYVHGWRDAFSAANIIKIHAQNNWRPGEVPTQKQASHNREMWVCIPKGVSYSQMRKVLLKYLRDNPEKLNETSNFLTLKAIQKAFRCR